MEDLSFYFSNEDNQSLYGDKERLNRVKRGDRYHCPKSFVSCEESIFVTKNGITFSSSASQLVASCDDTVRIERKSRSFPQDMPLQLPPEVEEGNIEYKRKLVNPSPNRFEHLVTQMKWRLNEGGGEAIYRLGVDDDGRISGLDTKELAYSLNTLQRMAKRLNATLHPLRERTVSTTNVGVSSPIAHDLQNQGSRKAVEFLVRQSPSNNRGEPSVCIAVLGGVDAGKSTLISVLTDGELDNGRGRARLNLFRHLHEVQSGRTSSLSSELLGFDAAGSVTNYTRADGRLCRASTDEVMQQSVQVLTLLDLAGHSKYQRTTLAGLSRCQPVAILLVVSATTGLTAVGLEHAELAHGLGLPLAVVISKIDLLDGKANRLRHTKTIRRQLACKLNQTTSRLPVAEDSGPEAISTSTKSDRPFSCPTVNSLPFFAVSAVTGEGMGELLRFLGRLACACRLSGHPRLETCCIPSGSSFGLGSGTNAPGHSNEAAESRSAEDNFLQSATSSLKLCGIAAVQSTMYFAICEVFPNVPGVRDPVVFGTLHSGQLMDNHLAYLGPDVEGYFHLVRIVSLKHNRQPHQVVFACQTASVAVRFQTSLSPPSFPSTKSDNLFLFENDENSPTQIRPSAQSHLPIMIRRGMVLISHASWSDWHGDMATIPLKIAHTANTSPSIAVVWAFTLEICCQLLALTGLNASPTPVKPPLPVPNQRVNVYAGCVAQAAIIVDYPAGTEEVQDQTTQDKNEQHGANQPCGRLLIRFTRHPEYLEVGRPVIITWAGYAKAVGHVHALHDLVTLDVDSSSSCKLQPDGQLATADPVSGLLSKTWTICDTPSPENSTLVDQLSFFFSEPECDLDEFRSTEFDTFSSSLGDHYCRSPPAESDKWRLSVGRTKAASPVTVSSPIDNIKRSLDQYQPQTSKETTTKLDANCPTSITTTTNPEQVRNTASVSAASKSTSRKRGRRRRRRKRRG